MFTKKFNTSIMVVLFSFYFTPVNAEAPSGPHIEISAGYDSLSLGKGIDSSSGVRYGLEAGYDVPLGSNVALGFNVGLSDTSAKSRQQISVFIPGAGPVISPFPPALPTPTRVIDIETSAGRELYVGGGLTASLSRKLNISAKAGYTNLRLKTTAMVQSTGAVVAGPIPSGPLLAPISATASDNLNGVRLGFGGQLELTKSLFLGVEYSYANYEADVSRNQLLTSLGVRF